MNPQLAFIQAFENFHGNECEIRTYNRGDFLTNINEIENELYVIIEGAVRAYYISENEEFSIRFGYENSIIGSIDSFFNQKPSQYYLQALRKSVVKVIPRKEYFNFINSSFDIFKAHSQLVEGIVIGQMEREIDLLTQSPKERYNRVLKRSPQLFQEIPLKYIASYLRMTPETLSRLRKED